MTGGSRGLLGIVVGLSFAVVFVFVLILLPVISVDLYGFRKSVGSLEMFD